MSGANNFEVFNEDYSNIMSDVDYAASSYRQVGAVDGIAPTTLYNKMFRQATVMTAALAAAMAAKEIDMLDSSLANLIISLGNLQIESEVDAKIAAAALNVSAFMLTVLDDETASAALTTLGVSTFIKTLLDDASASAARATLGVAFGAWVEKTANTVYQAATDGFVICVPVEVATIDADIFIFTSSSNPPTTKRSQNDSGSSTSSSSAFSPVRKNDYFLVTTAGSGTPVVYFIGIGV